MYTETDINIANMLIIGIATYFNQDNNYAGLGEYCFQVKTKSGEVTISYNSGKNPENPVLIYGDNEYFTLTSTWLIKEITDKTSGSRIRAAWNKAARSIIKDMIDYRDGMYATYLELLLLLIRYCPDLDNTYLFEDDLFGDLFVKKGKLFIDKDKAVLSFTQGSDLTQSLLEFPFWSLEQVLLIQGFSDNQELRYKRILNLAKEVAEVIQNVREEDLS